MGLQVTCDKCGKDVKGEFMVVWSTSYTTDDTEPIDYVAPGDEFYMCKECYVEFIKAVE